MYFLNHGYFLARAVPLEQEAPSRVKIPTMVHDMFHDSHVEAAPEVRSPIFNSGYHFHLFGIF